MKYIYFLLDALPELQNLLPRDIWLEIGEQQIKMFKELTARHVLNNPRAGSPRCIRHIIDGFSEVFHFEHRQVSEYPLLHWEVSYNHNVLIEIWIVMSGRTSGYITKYTL